MSSTTTIKYLPPSDSEMFRHGKAHLKRVAAGRGKRAEAAQAELERRARNKSAKKQASR